MDPRSPRLGLGLWGMAGPVLVNDIQLGWPRLQPGDARQIIAEAVDCGCRLFDTSDFYGLGYGEELLGEMRTLLPADALISTKGGLAPDRTASPGKIPRHFDSRYILACVDRSLKRLRTDHIHYYFLHGPDEDAIENEELWLGLQSCQSAGKIGKIGVSLRRSGIGDDDYLSRVAENSVIALVQAPVNVVSGSFLRSPHFGKLVADKYVIARSVYAHGMLLSPETVTAREYPTEDHRRSLLLDPRYGNLGSLRDQIATIASAFETDVKRLLLTVALELGAKTCLVGARQIGQFAQSAEAISLAAPPAAVANVRQLLGLPQVGIG